MNPRLSDLHPYPFERLRALFSGTTPPTNLKHINMGIGEPQHPTPKLLTDALIANLDGLSKYPLTLGLSVLRESIARWIQTRYDLENINPDTEVLPISGSREALFAFAQTAVDSSKKGYVICPNPFYQIYEGAAIMAGATPYFVNCTEENAYRPDYTQVPDVIWEQTQLVYVCSPGNPTGAVTTLQDWRLLFEKSDQFGFVIASDECYSEIYVDHPPPLGGLQAAQILGRDRKNLVMFSSLSKRSNAPGLRSGFVAGDAAILKQFLLYRTYHGTAVSNTVQMASLAAWNDEQHVIENRAKYQAKFDALTPRLAAALEVAKPEGGFFLWAKTPGNEEQFARDLYQQQNVTVLPGSYLARDTPQGNPGTHYVRLALVAEFDECAEAIDRIVQFCAQQS